jgi:hypothetical protein
VKKLYMQVCPIRPHAFGSAEDIADYENVVQMNTDLMLSSIDTTHVVPRRHIGVWRPIQFVDSSECCDLGYDAEREPTICEKCGESWQMDYLMAFFKHGTLRGVSFGCTCQSCSRVNSPMHPGSVPQRDNDEDMPDGGPGTYPEE